MNSIMTPNTGSNKTDFLAYCRGLIHRDGINELLDWLEKSDFFTAPASTKYHGAYEGGLCEHSLNVFDQLARLVHEDPLGSGCTFSDESIAIVSLFHDLCKVNMYKQDFKNVKVNGVWTQVPCYTHDEKFVFGGHGSKSVFLIERFMMLTLEEAVAINCHMGSWDGNKDVGAAFERYPLAWFTHVADEAATFLVEAKNSNE